MIQGTMSNVGKSFLTAALCRIFRQDGYSAGATMSQLAALMQEEGCQTAYNLDGGKSAVMVYDGKQVSQPIGAGRTISDIIYIGEVKQEVQK